MKRLRLRRLKMPIVLCRFCDYVGEGGGAWYDDDVILSMWADVQEHEVAEHSVELAELDGLEANPNG